MVYGLYGGRLYSQVAELVPLAVHISIRLRLCYNSYNPLPQWRQALVRVI